MASGILNSSLRQCCDINPFVTVSSLGDGCVTHFAGTSSAAPIAAAILALVLETNPDLTWRDVQHLIAMTAKVPDPKEPGWSVNGAGPAGMSVSCLPPLEQERESEREEAEKEAQDERGRRRRRERRGQRLEDGRGKK
ncbi:endoprotease bli isoform X1 [Salmo trutta]|uniref:endoprotease bli isoform X1 n=1 Tax=Salmo trutta TaxID=8032 RepID=UPI001130C298|nr:endoprotease bli-like isoform X1 [Salmo trutta]